MLMKYTPLFFGALFSLLGPLNAQQNLAQIAPGAWRAHVPMNRCQSIDAGANQLVLASQNGLWGYQFLDFERVPYTTAEGFSSIQPSALRYHQTQNWWIAGYQDGQIDLIKNGKIKAFPDLLSAGISSSRKVQRIFVTQDSAWLACDFGLVLVDMRQEVIRNSVLFSDNPLFTGQQCVDFVTFQNFGYAALSNGLYRFPLGANFKNLTLWEKINDIGAGGVRSLAVFQNHLVYLKNDQTDSIMRWAPGQSPQLVNTGQSSPIRSLRTSQNRLLVVADESVKTLNSSWQVDFSYSEAFGPFREAVISKEGEIFAASDRRGLVIISQNGATGGPPGPETKNVYDLKILEDGTIWVASGARSPTWGPSFRADQMFYRRNGSWKVLRESNDGYAFTHADFVQIAINPNDPSHLFVGSILSGLYEIRDFQYTNITQGPPIPLGQNRPGIGGLAFDAQSNLWFSPSYSDIGLIQQGTDGTTLQNVNFPGFTSVNVPTGDVLVDDLGHVWLASIGRGIAVYQPETGLRQYLTGQFNAGDLPSLSIRTMAKDRNGEIWVGTEDGIRVFSPGQLFTGQPVNGQRIVITAEDGNNELLLAQTVINDIAVDGANRKWIATQGAGVILVSDDGREVIHRFRAGDTPLFSDNVLCVAIDPTTGEVYFGTDLGIVSFRGNATEATGSFGDVYVFPNPVRETHDGPVTVAGLARDSDVIITDVAGNLVYKTQAQGGTATWNGLRYDGRRPATGVYLVFCTNEDGSEAMVTKFLYIH